VPLTRSANRFIKHNSTTDRWQHKKLSQNPSVNHTRFRPEALIELQALQIAPELNPLATIVDQDYLAVSR
jgi:hypothetical protein